MSQTIQPNAPQTGASDSQPTHEAISRRAYELFAQRGYRHGHALADWLTAESSLIAELEATRPPIHVAELPRSKEKRVRPVTANKTSRKKK